MTDYLFDLDDIPLWRPQVVWNEIPTWDFNIERQILEFEGTSQELTAFSQNKPNRFSFASLQFGKVEEKAILDFFEARKGSLEKFWFPLPIFLFDIMQEPPGGNIYKLLDWDFQGYERIYIERKNGDFFTKLVAYYEEENYWFVNWEIPDGEVNRIGLLILCRFENDSLNMEYLSCDISQTKINLIELVHEYQEIE